MPIFLLPLVIVFGEKLSKQEFEVEVDTINKILESTYQKHEVRVPEKLDDALFVRRLYIKAAGRIPTHDELSSYLSSSSKGKKNQLINDLVNSSAFDSQMFNWWADLLRLKTRMRGGNQIGAGQLYVHWVKEQVGKNIPFDEMAYNLVTAEGYPWEDGAVGYYLRDAGMPLDNMSNTTQIFLGTQMVCAQCHNHPFDRWTQMEYYQMASYTYGINSSKGGDIQSKIKKYFEKQTKGLSSKDKQKKATSKEAQALRRSVQEMLRPLRYGATHTNRKLTLPHDYQYADAKPKSEVSASPIFDNAISQKDGESKVHAYGEWLTTPENPRFTKVIANRIWKKVFGRGLVEPIDDWRDDTVASIPELLDHLGQLMVRVDYDLREFQRVLFQVKAFENASPAFIPNIETPYFFEAPLLERMSAEQIWDSLVALSIPEADDRKQNSKTIENRLSRFQEYQDEIYSLNADRLAKLARKGAKASKDINDQMEDIQKQLREAQEADDREAVARLRREYGQARNQQRTVFAKLVMGPEFEVKSLYGNGGNIYNKNDRWKGYSSQIYRASELQTPAQPGHFLQEFGQSDREISDNANRDASVTQALTLLNGTFYGALFNKESPLMKKLTEATSPEEKIKVLFFSILNREPTKEELKMCMAELSQAATKSIDYNQKIPEHLSKEKKKVLKKQIEKKLAWEKFNRTREYFAIAWSLINTRQFSFVQ
ncbi:MAG: DUF1549 domain-containing protein [Verrucomicrobiota bacterium]|nr:DUF1549 domain-containing protein [Verrucomicrobiota bacterium]